MKPQDSFSTYRRKYKNGHKDGNTWGGRLKKIAGTVPDRIAFIQGDRRLTWKQFHDRTNRLANALLDLGIEKEDRVAVIGFNTIEWMESYFAISKIGAVPVNVNPRFVAAEIRHILEDADAVAVITQKEHLNDLSAIKDDLPLLKHMIVMNNDGDEKVLSYRRLMDAYPPDDPTFSWKVTNEDFAFLFYTGGTTGYPKGTVWDYENRVRGLDAILLTALKPLIRRLPFLPGEAYATLLKTFPLPANEKIFKSKPVRWIINRYSNAPRAEKMALRIMGSGLNYRFMAEKMKLLVVAPLFHGTAYESAFSLIGAAAGTCIFLGRKHPFDPAELWTEVQRHRVNLMTIVGDAFAVPMIEELEKGNYDISTLVAIISSGVRFSPGIKKRFHNRHPGLIILDELGSTETSAAYAQVSSAADEDVGQLRIQMQNRGINVNKVINPVTGEEVKPGEKGELVFGGYNALGYWKDPEKTARHFRESEGRTWFFAGDEGVVDKEGYFHFLGRGSSIINTGGEKVYAEEVEDIILTHPRVRDAAVTGVPDDRWGEAVTALVEIEPGAGLGPEEIIAYCREKMAGYKKPRNVLILDRVPRSATGKLERGELKNLARELVPEFCTGIKK
ncbi:MAG: AMP-binding protein [Thermodesulfobacteriota bacterium]|nr:AMP-binding protein [Thermodesulfobacteriota bacterium]